MALHGRRRCSRSSIWRRSSICPRTPVGIVLLPLVLALVVAAGRASHEPFSPARTSFFWGTVHGVALLLGTVAVCVGFWAGLMYLVQSYALKQSPFAGRRLSTSQPRMARTRQQPLARPLDAADRARLRLRRRAQRSSRIATTRSIRSVADPVVISSAAMLLWLVAAEIFRWVYPAARGDAKSPT